jgi:hypothetical protein
LKFVIAKVGEERVVSTIEVLYKQGVSERALQMLLSGERYENVYT